MARLATIGFVLSLLLPALVALNPDRPILDAVLVENFDNDGSAVYPSGSKSEDGDVSGSPVVWGVRGSRYRSEGYPMMTYVEKNWPFSLYGIYPDNAEQLKVLGVRVKFDKLGYNNFSILPGVGEGDAWKAVPLPLSGQDRPREVQSFSVWVWGAGFNYSIEVLVQDYRGFLHALPLLRGEAPKRPVQTGNLDFQGWQRMVAVVPQYIPQDARVDLQETRLRLVKFFVHTAPDERVDDFFIYFDQLKVLTDESRTNFYDGRELAERSIIGKIWGEEKGTAKKAASGEANNG